MTTVPQSSAGSVPSVPQTFKPAPAPEEYRPRFNLRLWIFILAISAPFLYIIGSAVVDSMTGGISDHGSYKEVDLKALGNFSFNDMAGKMEDIPERYRQLDGQRVMLKGFMYGAEGAADRGVPFQFVYNVSKCCFNGPPQVQERVFVRPKKGTPVYDSYTFAEIVGTLHVRLVKDPASGKIVSVYDMDIESAKQVQG